MECLYALHATKRVTRPSGSRSFIADRKNAQLIFQHTHTAVFKSSAASEHILGRHFFLFGFSVLSQPRSVRDRDLIQTPFVSIFSKKKKKKKTRKKGALEIILLSPLFQMPWSYCLSFVFFKEKKTGQSRKIIEQEKATYKSR